MECEWHVGFCLAAKSKLENRPTFVLQFSCWTFVLGGTAGTAGSFIITFAFAYCWSITVVYRIACWLLFEVCLVGSCNFGLEVGWLMFAFGRLLGCFEGYTVYGLSAYTFKA